REAGDSFLIGENEYIVSGVLKRSGTQDDGMIFAPLAAAQSVFNKEGQITMLGIKLDKDADIAAFEEELYKLPDVQVVSMAQVRNTIMSLVSSAKVIVMSIVAIAFAIAMFGVLNTVLMSVFERYQEIGILKSMGAMPFDIFKMVLFETTILCGIGGIIGVSVAILISGVSEYAIRYFIPFAPTGGLIQINSTLALTSVAAIIAIGLAGGIYPALRAASIRPLSAIRSEE
ncbi:MAG: FtsX-like permease family protein, partial [Deferribacteraceae bacterium]|nr:FtsX-like permease family protein [Deferribacteraceae bacterium]